jgi:predicted secreted protein
VTSLRCRKSITSVVAAAALLMAATAIAKTVSLTATASGHTVKVHKGDVVKITLAENPSTGYSWQYLTRPNAKELAQKSWKYVASPHKPRIVGSGGKLHITYDVVGTGTTNLRLVDRQGTGRKARTGGSFNLTVSAS